MENHPDPMSRIAPPPRPRPAALAAIMVSLVLAVLALGMVFGFVSSPASADASSHAPAIDPAQARLHRLADALPVQHGTYVRDPYGCLYMFQYLAGSLSVTPVKDGNGQPVCR